MKVLVLGATGMLGHMVALTCLGRGFETALTFRETSRKILADVFGHTDAVPCPMIAGGTDFQRVLLQVAPDAVVNCIGAVRQHNPSVETYIALNVVFPLRVAQVCKTAGCPCIHITTDCVFDGRTGAYSEDDAHSALDAYGKTKSLGESPDAMVLRTSIVGPELHHFVGLLEWARGQKSRPVNGWANHLWNGVTTKELARCIADILADRLYECGTFHLLSPTTHSKHEMLQLFDKRYALGLAISAVEASQPIDRTLATNRALNGRLCPLPFPEQLRALPG